MRKRIRDPIHSYVELDDEILKIVDNEFFQRLRYIKQNGLAYLVFPSANHTRFEHSLGTFHIASMMINNLESKDIDVDVMKKVALLHDIGHLPFSHTFEDAMKILFYMDNSKYMEIMSKIGVKTPYETAKFHEYLGIFILKNCMEGLEDVANKMEEIYVKKKGGIEKSLISSTFDADRLDYLQRDSYYFGVRYGLIPLDRILTVMRINSSGKYVFDSKGRDDLEHFLIARYHMYSAVYSHPVKGLMDMVMAFAIAKMIKDNVISVEDLTSCEKIVNFTDDFILMKLKENPSYRQFYETIYKRIKYKKKILEDQDADNFISKYPKEKEKELYDFIIRSDGRLVIYNSKIDMPVENVILNIQGKEIDLDKVDKTKYINIPKCRIKIVIGYKDDETYKEFEKNYFK